MNLRFLLPRIFAMAFLAFTLALALVAPALAERSSIVYAGKTVAAGTRTAVVDDTGAHTQSPRAARLDTGGAAPYIAAIEPAGRVASCRSLQASEPASTRIRSR